MNVWLVSPAWRRYAVTGLVLTQWAWLRDCLAARGWAVHAVIVADDDNLELARARGFSTVEMPNDHMGAKWNAGFRHAAAAGADLFVYVGSDDWVHPDTFAAPPSGNEVQAGRHIDFVDLTRGVLQRAVDIDRHGAIPWLIPRAVLAACDFAPMPERTQRGTEAALAHGLTSRPEWTFRPGPATCVDFKTADSVSPYAGVANSIGDRIELDAWAVLGRHYPAHLVDQARALHDLEAAPHE